MALGNPDRGDDGAALAVAERLQEETTVILAGRPGPQLLDLLPEDDPCILLDVTWSGAPPGTLVRIPLAELTPGLLPDLRVSSHGFGPGEALALARALGRRLPPGVFLGIEGESYEMGAGPSPAVLARLPELEDRVRASICAMAREPAHPPPPQSRA